MDQRIRALEKHFYLIPNAISLLGDYYNNFDENILTLDLSIRQLINGNSNNNDVNDTVNNYLIQEQPIPTRNSYNILDMVLQYIIYKK